MCVVYGADTEAKAGDQVTIAYSGDATNRPEAVTITVTQAAVQQSISGEVLMHDATSIFVQISSQEVFGIVVDKDTKVTGKATSVVTGDTVTVTYEGSLHAAPTALTIEITTAVKNRKEKQVTVDSATNKDLDGYVTRLSSKVVTIRTGKGRAYTFKRNSATVVSGSYDLEVGARITVTYDGYASKSPAAKRIYVIAPPDPTPTAAPTKYRSASGLVESFVGIFLNMDTGMAFNCTYASYSGNGSGNPGDGVKVTYYIGDDGVYYATKVVFTAPQQKPTVTKSTSGTVESFGGMYLSLINGIGFDCAYASISGNGYRVPGEYADVVYYVGDDGMNYATRIVFTAVEEFPKSEFELDPSLGEPDPEVNWDDYPDEPVYEPDESAYESEVVGEDTGIIEGAVG